jgi:hypothetical protein
MSIRQRLFTSNAVAFVVFFGSVAFMIATLAGWDPTFGALDRPWRHPLLIAVLLFAVIVAWFTCRSKYRDTAGRWPIRQHAAAGMRLGIVGLLFSLGWAVALGGWTK